MLGAGYFLKIAEINFQQEKPICPNLKDKFRALGPFTDSLGHFAM